MMMMIINNNFIFIYISKTTTTTIIISLAKKNPQNPINKSIQNCYEIDHMSEFRMIL